MSLAGRKVSFGIDAIADQDASNGTSHIGKGNAFLGQKPTHFIEFIDHQHEFHGMAVLWTLATTAMKRECACAGLESDPVLG